MSVHMGHTCRLMHALILLFVSPLCMTKHLDPNQPHLTALTGLTTVPLSQQPWQSQSFHPNLSLLHADTRDPQTRPQIPAATSLALCGLPPSPLFLLAWPWSQHDMPHLPPCTHSSGLPPLLMPFQFLLLSGSSFSCFQTVTLRPASSRDSPKSWQVRRGLVTP